MGVVEIFALVVIVIAGGFSARDLYKRKKAEKEHKKEEE